MLLVTPFAASCQIFATAVPAPLSPELEREVGACWQEAQSGGRTLFNGAMLSLRERHADQLICEVTEYRRWWAQTRHPDLFTELGIRPLAVCGLLLCADGLIVGRRSTEVTQDPGCWELAPSGGIAAECVDATGRVDWRRQLLEELREELGITATPLAPISALCLIEDDESRVVDIGIVLETALTAAEILGCHAGQGSDEYSSVQVVAQEHWPRLLSDTRLAAVSKALLGYYLQQPAA